jgi:flagellar M-ring protein FliF
MPFVAPPDVADTAPAASPAKVSADLVTFIQMIALGVVGFGIIILTARSILAGLNKEPASLALAAGTLGADGISLPGGHPDTPGIEHTGADGKALTDESDAVANAQAQLRASAIGKVTALVERHPDATLGILRGWMALDQG